MSNQNKPALFFVNSLSGGGAEKVCLNLASALYEQGSKSIFVTCYKSSECPPDYIEEYCLNFNGPKLSIKNNSELKNFISEYSQTDFCLITAHLPMSWLVASATPWSSKCIFVLHNYSMHLRIMAPLAKFIFGKTFLANKKISCVSKGLCDWLIKAFHLSPKNVTAIYNPICIQPSDDPSPFPFPYILVMGRLCYQKNQKLAIKIFSRLQNSNNLQLVIAGEGKDKNKLVRYANKLNLQDRVKFLPYQNDPAQLLTNANLVLSTSRYEGFNMIVAESIACKTPVIATNCKFGPSEILKGASSKYLLNSKNFHQTSIKKITYFLTDTSSCEFAYPDIKIFHRKAILNNYINFFIDKDNKSVFRK